MSHELDELLLDAVDLAERLAPPVDPVAAVHAARRRRRALNGQIAALAFVLLVLGLQLLPASAFGEQAPGPGKAAATWAAGLTGSSRGGP